MFTVETTKHIAGSLKKGKRNCPHTVLILKQNLLYVLGKNNPLK